MLQTEGLKVLFKVCQPHNKFRPHKLKLFHEIICLVTRRSERSYRSLVSSKQKQRQVLFHLSSLFSRRLCYIPQLYLNFRFVRQLGFEPVRVNLSTDLSAKSIIFFSYNKTAAIGFNASQTDPSFGSTQLILGL